PRIMIARPKSPDSGAPEPVVLTHCDDRGVLTITLNRPQKRNALNEEMVDLLRAAFTQAKDDPAIKVVVLEAAGNDFCAGIDLKELATKIEANVISQDKEGFKAYMRKYADLLHLMNSMPTKPIIGVLQGNARGLGCTMALLCDYVTAAETAIIEYPEKNFNSKPWLSGYYAMRKLGVDNALKYFSSGE